MATYILLIEVASGGTVSIGRAGRSHIPEGLYLYVGSAKRGLKKRIQRHAARNKKCRWHIDYILNREETRIREVWTNPADAECQTAAAIDGMAESHVVKRGLGSSDCNCPTHFYRFNATRARLRDRLRALSFAPAQKGIIDGESTVSRGAPACG